MGTVEPVRLRFGEFELDEANARLLRNGVGVALAPKAFAVLCALARRPGQLLTKNALLDEVWGHQHVSESVLKTLISELRATLADDARQPRYIETASRKGYRFIGASAGMVLGAAVPHVKEGPKLPSGPPLISRTAELQRLRQAWQRTRGGRRQLVWIVGEPGVGKTTLVEAFLRELEPSQWVRGQCVEQFGAGEPYRPVLEALTVLCKRDPRVPEMLRTAAPTWLMQMPWLCTEAERAELRRELAGATQDRMARELRQALADYGRPLVVLVEDLHWSDEATLRMMDAFARNSEGGPFLWLGTFRLAEATAEDHPLRGIRHELRLHKLCEELVLDPFSENEVEAYLQQRFPGTPIQEDFTRQLHAHTDGLPLFVANMVDEMVAQGAVPANAVLEQLSIPEGLFGVIEKQLARLDATQRAVLEAAAVCGMEFRARTVADALERSVGDVGACCDALARQGLWLGSAAVTALADGTLDARYEFRHALYKRVLYQGLGAITRAQFHRRVAASLERSSALGVAVPAAELALHHELSLNFPAALRAFSLAARAALQSFAPAEALRLTDHAFELLPRIAEGPERDELELHLLGPRAVATAQRFGVGAPQAEEAFRRARILTERLPPAPTRAYEMIGLGWVHYVRAEFPAARAAAARVEMLGQERDDLLMRIAGCNLMGVVVGQEGGLVAARSWLERALAMCGQLKDEVPVAPFVIDPQVSISANLVLFMSNLGFVDEAERQRRAALARASALKQPMAQMLAWWCSGIGAWRTDDLDLALLSADGLERVSVGEDLAQGQGPAKWMRGWVMARRGEPAAGYDLIMKGYERHARFGMYAGCPIVMGYAAEALLLAGRLPEARAHVDEGLGMAERTGDRVYVPDLCAMKARILQSAGEIVMARTAIDAGLAEARAQKALWPELALLAEQAGFTDAGAGDFAALAACEAQLVEGQRTPLRRRVRQLLDSRRAA